jgi:hypothetical protein
LLDRVDRVPNIYNINEGWVVKKMRSKYANRIVAILLIIYQKDKVQYFNNKSIWWFLEQIMESLLIGLQSCILNW